MLWYFWKSATLTAPPAFSVNLSQSRLKLSYRIDQVPARARYQTETCQNQGWVQKYQKIINRGGTKSWILKPQVNFNVTPIYKNREKRIFVFCVHLDPPHWPSNFENHHYRVKNQNCRRPLEWPIKTSAREALGQWKKTRAQSDLPVLKKNPKNPLKILLFRKVVFSGGFWDFSLVNPNEL